jgi:UDP-N-acetylglucosamine--N-acetylmuramyl-(pentapeptide) pyrophosphoryl-undecaprenol N-acetylglucosamine transferase
MFSDKIMLSWQISEKYFPRHKTVLTGNPSWVDYNKDEKEEIKFNNDLPIITFIGGNQGAHIVNTALFSVLPEVLKIANVIHQTGRSEITGDKYTASEIKSTLTKTMSERYIFQPYIINNIYEVFNKSDLIVTRGGANTMTDIILKAKKSIVIPIPWSSGGEQLKNAEFLKSLGLSEIIQYENEINPEELLNKIKEMLKREDQANKPKIKKLQTRVRYSAQKIVKVVEEILSK